MGAPESIKRVWLLSFELDGFARLGGLGVAVARYVRALVRRGLEVTVFVPSHGRHADPELRRRLELRPLEWFSAVGRRVGVNGRVYGFSVGAEVGQLGGARLVVFKGLDPETSRIIDDPDIYREAPEKACLYARALRRWAEVSGEVPDLVHSNDWTSGLAAVMLKVYLERRGLAIPHLHTVHLLASPSFPWHYASEQWCGLEDVEHRLWVGHRHELRSARSVWDSVGGNVDHFTVLEADAVSAATSSYLREVLDRFGRWLEPKTCVVRNVTDWRLDSAREAALRLLGTDSRRELRRRIVDYVGRELGVRGYGRLEGVEMLAMSSGRLVWQKGFDMLVRSLAHVDGRVGLLIAGIRAGDSEFESELRSLAERFAGRVLVLLDPLPGDLLRVMVYSSNVFVVPSRYEPFGLVSIEAQALGTPVVVSCAGGLPETVLDLRSSPEGSGVVVCPWDERELGAAVESLAFLTEAADGGSRELVERTAVGWLRELALRHGVNVRENAVRWVDRSFREEVLEEELLRCYERARLYAYYRSVA